MRFLFIISHDDQFRPTAALIKNIRAWIRKMKRRGVRIDGNPLRPACDATTVRVRGGKLKRTPGPFVNSKEKMCAYELVECATLDEAVALAAQHPMASAATIEVRPVWDDLAG